MKKTLSAAALLPSLMIASGVIFASNNGNVMDLNDASESLKQFIQEQKEHVKPIPPGGVHPDSDHHEHPNQPGHPDKPDQHPQPLPHPQPQPNPHPNPQPQPQPQPVDTTQAYQAGLREGSERGRMEGRRQGYSDGIEAGERDGRRRGYDEGNQAGRNSGYRDGWNVDQSVGIQKGRIDGQNAGTNNGTRAGERRCYDEGYTRGYNNSFAEAKILGLQDRDSYNAGYAKGQADAAVTESDNGQRAGYQAGFSQREAELQSSFADIRTVRGFSIKKVSDFDLPVELARAGYNTPEEKQAYERGFREGYQRSYRIAYEDAKRDGYNERYNNAYRRAYDAQFSIAYREGFAQGKDEGYQSAYSSAYNSAYNSYYQEYSSREYPEQRDLGMSKGRADGQREGFQAGCAEQNKKGYKDGYEKKAAEVYPNAFALGKQSGIAAADKYYAENSVLKAVNIAFYDENNDGKFEAGENVMLKAEINNFGFQKSETIGISVKSERGEILISSELSGEAVNGRSKSSINLRVGKLYDVVSPDADALYVTFSEKGRLVGDFRQMYTRTNPNKVGIVANDDTSVTEKATWFFPGKITSLNKGEKVLIIGEKGDYFKVRKSEMSSGKWSEGYISKGKLNLQ